MIANNHAVSLAQIASLLTQFTMSTQPTQQLTVVNDIIQLCPLLHGYAAVNSLKHAVYSSEWVTAEQIATKIPATTSATHATKQQILEKIMEAKSLNQPQNIQTDGIDEHPCITLNSVFATFDNEKNLYRLASGMFASKECVERAVDNFNARKGKFVDVSNNQDSTVRLDKTLGSVELTHETDISGSDAILAKLHLRESLCTAHIPGMIDIIKPLHMSDNDAEVKKLFTSVLIVSDLSRVESEKHDNFDVVKIREIVKYTTK